MEPVSSYADPLTGSVTLKIRIPEVDFRAIRADCLAPSGGWVPRVNDYVWRSAAGLWVHEWAHIFQIASYPLLYLRAARQGKMMGNRMSVIRNAPNDTRLPLHLAPVDRWHWSSLIETVPTRLRLVDEGVAMTSSKSMEPRRGTIRETDLLEEDATVLQYRVEVGSRGTGHGYRRWLTERPRYSALFSFLSDLFGEDDALQLIPVMARIAFSTTRPMEALAAILTDLVRDGSDVYTEEFPNDEWDSWAEDFFRGRVLDGFGAATDVSIDFQHPALDDSQGVITPEQHLELMEATPHLLARVYAYWSIEDNNLLSNVLCHPWKYFSRGGYPWSEELNRYVPAISTYHLIADETNEEIGLIVHNPTMKTMVAPEALHPDGHSVTVSAIAFEAIRAKSIHDVAMGIREPLITCPHISCRFHRTQLCRGWLEIPKDPEQCEFPGWFTAATDRTVSTDGMTLINLRKEQP